MLPHYRTKIEPETRWEVFKEWLSDITPFAVFIIVVVILFIIIHSSIPHCPKCNKQIHPMYVYCSQCGYQLRTTGED